MGFRFRKSIKIFPGLRVNLSKTGASLSVGGRGASVNIGPRGTYANVGLPGTGLSYRERIDPPGNKSSRRSTSQAPGSYRIEIENDAIIIICENGDIASSPIRKKLIEQNYNEIQNRLEEIAEERNQKVEQALRICNANVRICDGKPRVEPGESVSSHMARIGEWRAKMANSAEERLVGCLQSIEWGKEPDILCEIVNGEILVQVELPGIESIPATRYKVAMSPAPRIAIQSSTATQRNEIYTRFVCSNIMAVTDAIILAMPDVKTTKIEAKNGQSRNDAIATLEVVRDRWISKEDGVDSLERFLRMGGTISPRANGKLAAVKSILK